MWPSVPAREKSDLDRRAKGAGGRSSREFHHESPEGGLGVGGEAGKHRMGFKVSARHRR